MKAPEALTYNAKAPAVRYDVRREAAKQAPGMQPSTSEGWDDRQTFTTDTIYELKQTECFTA